MMFFCCSCALSIIGCIFIYSAGTYWGQIHYAEALPFYIKQMLYLIAAFLLFLLVLRLRFLTSDKFIQYFYIISIVLLVLVLIPGIGVVRNGSQSWIAIGSITFQPAEAAKLSTLLYLSSVLAKRNKYKRIVQWKHFVIVLVPISCIMLQPDFGSAFILILASLTLLFLANYPLKLYALVITIGVAAMTVLMVSAPYRLKRLESFLDPWADPLGAGFQAVQAALAIGPAGIFGHGFLKSRQKYLHLPEPQNDFIFAIILEEIGLIGGIGIMLIFACFLYSGYQLAMASNRAKSFYAIGSLVTLLAIQIFLNIAVVVGLVPVTGVTLPFISYGGTSLLSVWLTVAWIWRFANLTYGEEE